MAERERLICAASDLAEQGKGVRFEMNRFGKLQPAFVVRFDGQPPWIGRKANSSMTRGYT